MFTLLSYVERSNRQHAGQVCQIHPFIYVVVQPRLWHRARLTSCNSNGPCSTAFTETVVKICLMKSEDSSDWEVVKWWQFRMEVLTWHIARRNSLFYWMLHGRRQRRRTLMMYPLQLSARLKDFVPHLVGFFDMYGFPMNLPRHFNMVSSTASSWRECILTETLKGFSQQITELCRSFWVVWWTGSHGAPKQQFEMVMGHHSGENKRSSAIHEVFHIFQLR